VRSESTTSNSIDTVYEKTHILYDDFLVLNERSLKVQCRRDIRRVKATYTVLTYKNKVKKTRVPVRDTVRMKEQQSFPFLFLFSNCKYD